MNTISRLQSFSNETAELFSQSDLNHKRAAALTACLCAIELNAFVEPEVQFAVQCINAEKNCDDDTIYKLLALADKYDNLYFSEIEKSNDEITSMANNYFLKARALSALNIYLSKNIFELDEVIYESILSTDDTNMMLNIKVQSLSN